MAHIQRGLLFLRVSRLGPSWSIPVHLWSILPNLSQSKPIHGLFPRLRLRRPHPCPGRSWPIPAKSGPSLALLATVPGPHIHSLRRRFFDLTPPCSLSLFCLSLFCSTVLVLLPFSICWGSFLFLYIRFSLLNTQLLFTRFDNAKYTFFFHNTIPPSPHHHSNSHSHDCVYTTYQRNLNNHPTVDRNLLAHFTSTVSFHSPPGAPLCQLG